MLADNNHLQTVRELRIAYRDPLRVDFDGKIEVKLSSPTAGGHYRIVITAGVVDWQAEEFLGRHNCHRLAAALHCLTGWDIITFDILRGDTWWPTHSAVRTPDGDLLDIFGRSTLAEAEATYRGDGDSTPRHRVVAVSRIPGDVLRGIDHLRGNKYWWAAERPIGLVAVHSHFARHLLRANGYPHLADSFSRAVIRALRGWLTSAVGAVRLRARSSDA